MLDYDTGVFLESLFEDCDNLIEIREIGSRCKNNLFYKSVEELKERYKIPMDRHVYFGVSSRGHKKNGRGKISGGNDNCVDTKALWFDFDKISLQEVQKRLEWLGKPTFLIGSGNGYHAYYLLDQREKTEDVMPVLRILTEKLGADKKVASHSKIMRVPGSVNQKNGTWCDIIEMNAFNVEDYKLDHFKDLVLEELADTREKRGKKSENFGELSRIAENSSSYCIGKMLYGVKKGDRHVALLRLTKYFQVALKMDKERALDLILSWNLKNKPMEARKDLIYQFEHAWARDYKFLGCGMNGVEKFCKKERCSRKPLEKVRVENVSVCYSNRLFTRYEKVSGNELIILGLLQMFPEGLTFAELKEKVTTLKSQKTFLTDTTRRKVLKSLASKKMVKENAGREVVYEYIKKGNYNSGYVKVSPALLKLALLKHISQAEYKLLVLLKRYSRKEDEKNVVFPTEVSLARELGVTQSAVSQIVSSLEKKQCIEKIYYIKRGYDYLKYRILV